MGYLKQALKAQKGFTLVEMTVVIAIIAVLAALSLPAVTGLTTTSRGTSKTGDLKEVEQAVARYESTNPGSYPVSVVPSTPVTDANGDGFIDIHVTDFASSPGAGAVDATCKDTAVADALANCFGSVTFSSLVPEFIKSNPQHTTGTAANATATSTSTPDGNLQGDNDFSTVDLTIPDCDLAGRTCRFYIEESFDLATVLKVWNVSQNGAVYIFKENAVYGK
jgi:prepilin-type N-terminal cleavage/methylation domain-containing protein